MIERSPMARTFTPEQRANLSRKLKGRKLPEEHRQKIKAWAEANGHLCRPSDEHLAKLSALFKGKPFSGKTFDHTGRIQSDDERSMRKLRAVRGPEHHNWKDGLSYQRKRERNTVEYLRWRRAVIRRDKFTCQMCDAKGVQLTVHHNKSWSAFPELRFDVANGITLCEPCHAKVDPHFKKTRGL